MLKYVRCQRSYGFLITKELIFGFQILDIQDHFSASLKIIICIDLEYIGENAVWVQFHATLRFSISFMQPVNTSKEYYENKVIMQFGLFENEIRPEVLQAGIQ